MSTGMPYRFVSAPSWPGVSQRRYDLCFLILCCLLLAVARHLEGVATLIDDSGLTASSAMVTAVCACVP
jgi:hypothetical protein